jgi:penicillin-binding protein 1A
LPFRVPPGIKLIRVDPKTGLRAGPGTDRVILEAFKPGTAPPDSYSVVGFTDVDGNPIGGDPNARSVPMDSDRAIRQGTGGLY